MGEARRQHEQVMEMGEATRKLHPSLHMRMAPQLKLPSAASPYSAGLDRQSDTPMSPYLFALDHCKVLPKSSPHAAPPSSRLLSDCFNVSSASVPTTGCSKGDNQRLCNKDFLRCCLVLDNICTHTQKAHAHNLCV